MNNKSVSIKINQHLYEFLKNKLKVKINLHEENILLRITENQQCIACLGEYIFFCCAVPFVNWEALTMEPLQNEFLILVESNEHGCFVLSMKDRKVIEYWSDAMNVFIDDYLDIGHDQVIVVFPDNKFYVTDFDCCWVDTRDGKNTRFMAHRENANAKSGMIIAASHEDRADKNQMVNMILDKKVMSMKNTLCNSKANIKQKESLLQQTCDLLVSMTLGEPQPINTHNEFVPLLDDDEDDESYSFESKLSPKNLSISNYCVQNHWFKRLGENLVHGFTLKKNLLAEISNFAISLKLNGSSTTKCHQKIPLDNMTSGSWNTFESKEFVVVTDLPIRPHSENLNYKIFVYYTKLGKNYSESIGNVSISRLDLLNIECCLSKSYLNRDVNENTVIKTACSCLTFDLISSVSSLRSLATSLSRRFNVKKDQIGNIFVLLLNSLKGEIRLQSGSSHILGTIYALSNSYCLLIWEELKQLLPADVEVRQKINNRQIEYVETCIASEIEFGLQNIEFKESKESEDDVIILDTPPHKRPKIDQMEFENKYLERQMETDCSVINAFNS